MLICIPIQSLTTAAGASFGGGGVHRTYGGVGADIPHKMYPVHQSCPHGVVKSQFCMHVSRQESCCFPGMLHLNHGRHIGVPFCRIQRNRPGFNRAVTQPPERHAEGFVPDCQENTSGVFSGASRTRLTPGFPFRFEFRYPTWQFRVIIIIPCQRLYIGQNG